MRFRRTAGAVPPVCGAFHRHPALATAGLLLARAALLLALAGAARAGTLGDYPMTRDGSGTSWQPDATAHQGMHLMLGDWHVMVHGMADLIADRQSGPRGGDQVYSTSMLMGMAGRELGEGQLDLRAMASLDPLMGKAGYPELFQSGETADGRTPLVDRQHPHNALMELAATLSWPLGDARRVFVYGGPVAEPALGPTAYMHRASAQADPQAPISHHWLDSTHVADGVLTAGLVQGAWKLEASAFHGREPDQFRWRTETGGLDSQSARLAWNPAPAWSLQLSRGHLHSPEALQPGIAVARSTASLMLHPDFEVLRADLTLAWGHNRPNAGPASSAWLAEGTLGWGRGELLTTRIEQVDKDELFLPPSPLQGQTLRIRKLSLAYLHEWPAVSHLVPGLGVALSTFAVPDAAQTAYGNRPYGLLVFLRMRLG